jgi:hypothetical protein
MHATQTGVKYAGILSDRVGSHGGLQGVGKRCQSRFLGKHENGKAK